MLFQPWEDIGKVESRSVGGTDWMCKGLKGDGAEVERQSLEGGTRRFGLGDTGAGAGRVCIFRSPLGMSNLRSSEEVRAAAVDVLTYSLSVPKG